MTAFDREALLESWRVTTEYLLAARRALSDAAVRGCEHELRLFGEYLDRNELELALECLESVLGRRPGENDEARQHVALAARSMGLVRPPG